VGPETQQSNAALGPSGVPLQQGTQVLVAAGVQVLNGGPLTPLTGLDVSQHPAPVFGPPAPVVVVTAIESNPHPQFIAPDTPQQP
jgi:hypothetical protein